MFQAKIRNNRMLFDALNINILVKTALQFKQNCVTLATNEKTIHPHYCRHY